MKFWPEILVSSISFLSTVAPGFGGLITFGNVCTNTYYRAENLCDPFKNLICYNGKCNCSNPEIMVYDNTSERCVVKLGISCLQENLYTVNSQYIYDKNSIIFANSVKLQNHLPCVQGAFCNELTDFKCWCSNPYDLGTNGICTLPPIPSLNDGETLVQSAKLKVLNGLEKAEFFIPCNTINTTNNCPAGSGLRCVDGMCKCPIPNQQNFDGTLCLSHVGVPCGPYVDASGAQKYWGDCTPFAQCILINSISNCQCISGFGPNQSGKCVPDYGRPCNNLDIGCRKESLLSCVDGTCQCENMLHVYDPIMKHCRGLVGASCQEAGKYFPKSEFCIQGAECLVQLSTAKGIPQEVCRCQQDSLETANRTCSP